jgi:hypothetical protein
MAIYKKRALHVAAAGFSALVITSAPVMAFAAPLSSNGNMTATYQAHLDELNDSGVSGRVHLNFHKNGDSNEAALRVDLFANGTTPDQTHPVHIHGNEHPEVAFCPTNAQDVNDDGFVSVVEGAATYGPIKLNLTSPQTEFGTPPTPALFTPFAGTPDPAAFPMADAHGNIGLNQTYTFDNSEAAQGALETLTPLENQHIVVHGDMAPESVDADAFAALGMPSNPNSQAVIYDPLLPIACGEIEKTSANDRDDSSNADGRSDDATGNNQAVAQFHDRVNALRGDFDNARQAAQAHFEATREANRGEARDQFIGAVQSAHDRFMNQFFEARNQLVDQLNRSGATELRNEVTAQAEHDAKMLSHEFEASKNEFAARSEN